MAEIVVDVKALEDVARDMRRAKRALLGQLAKRGYELLRDEVPVETGSLKQGVAAPDVNYDRLEATLTVSARSARVGGGQGVIMGADGKERKRVSISPRPAFNYAEAVARGRAAIRPKTAKVLLIPVPTAPAGESYLLAGGQIFVFRRSAKATRPNPFDERAAKRLEGEAQAIGDAVLKKLFN